MFDHKIPADEIEPTNTAVVFTDLHNDFLAPEGKAFGLLSESLARNNTAENIERLRCASQNRWHEGVCLAALLLSARSSVDRTCKPTEDLAHKIGLLNRKGP